MLNVEIIKQVYICPTGIFIIILAADFQLNSTNERLRLIIISSIVRLYIHCNGDFYKTGAEIAFFLALRGNEILIYLLASI